MQKLQTCTVYQICTDAFLPSAIKVNARKTLSAFISLRSCLLVHKTMVEVDKRDGYKLKAQKFVYVQILEFWVAV